MSLSHRNQSIDIQSKTIDWFLRERELIVKGLILDKKLLSKVFVIFIFSDTSKRINVCLEIVKNQLLFDNKKIRDHESFKSAHHNQF